jgi:hypothetical protein
MSPSLLNVAQAKTVGLDPGLFVVRYMSSPARIAPVVTIASERGRHRDLVLLAPPGYSAGELVQPGDALVVQARQRAELSVQVRPSVADGSWEAEIAIERLGRSPEEAEDVATSEVADETLAKGPIALELLAHVARLGDIRVSPGEWIAGPKRPARIEGLALTWQRASRDLELKYAVRVGGIGSRLMQANGDGAFVGTRGQARPLTEVRFELDGPAAKDSELVIDALFEGGMPEQAEGRSICLSGPSGREALVGLRVELIDAHRRNDLAMTRSVKDVGGVHRCLESESTEHPSRVRVFRGSGNRKAATRNRTEG